MMAIKGLRHPESLTRNESSEINNSSSPSRKRGSRATAQSDQRVAATSRRAVYRLPLDSRVRGNDDRRSTYWKTSIHFRPASEEARSARGLEGRTARLQPRSEVTECCAS